MQYDPIKNTFASFIKEKPLLRKIFYHILDLIFLRSWYIRDEIKKAIFHMQKVKLDVYDAGTGFGQYSYFVAKNYPNSQILSIDIKKDYIKDCELFFSKVGFRNVRFAIEDLTQITHKNKFDMIICVDVMEHIEDDIKVFQNYFNALKPNGLLIVNTPSSFGGSDVHDENEDSFIGEHFRDGYSIEDYKTKLTPLGFKIQSAKYTYGYWGDKAWRLAIKFPILMLNFSKLLLIFLPFYYLIFLPIALVFMCIDFKSNIPVGSGIIVTARK